MCEQDGMSHAPGTMELADRAGISKSYASEIVNGLRRPSRPLAIHIMRSTGWRHASIAALTDDQIEMLESVEPYRKPSTSSVAAA
jgi:transcriptional regulator with XRE-family HTH domain